VAAYIDETLDSEERPIKAEKVLSIVSSQLQELEEDAKQGWQDDDAGGDGGNAGAAGGMPQPAEGDGNVTTEPQQVGGGSNANAPPSNLRSSSRLHGGLSSALESYKRRLNVAVDQANHVNLDDLEA
jgi:hypothetical protein